MATDYFLKLEGIQGESQDDKHKDEIQILSWSWGASNVSSVSGTGGSGAGKVNLSDLSVMVNFDKSTPKFFKTVCAGTHVPSGTLTAIKAGADGKPYLKVDFKELFVTSLQISASSEVPTVSVSFSYNEIKIDYSTQNEQGNVTSTGAVTYNTKGNKLS
ncbi:MAG TPA: type VI secretion system tube protein Hcp [Terracidiphilus sp.]|jgi:type VI secretion system secreted protein Hcp|nr:type VI secretion system tube protein Hcp [Terracidiphilus sp.]